MELKESWRAEVGALIEKFELVLWKIVGVVERFSLEMQELLKHPSKIEYPMFTYFTYS